MPEEKSKMSKKDYLEREMKYNWRCGIKKDREKNERELKLIYRK